MPIAPSGSSRPPNLNKQCILCNLLNVCCRLPAGWVYCMMATAGVSLLERQRRYKEAIERLDMLLGESPNA